VPLWITPGSFPDVQPHTPLIMVGPGTGVAPMRAFLQSRLSTAAVGAPAPDMLFFGCRHRAKDFLFGGEFEALGSGGKLELHAAFSRDQPAKVYVTHKLREAGSTVWRLLSTHQATVLVAGSAGQMPKDVHAAFQDIARKHGGMDEKQASNFVRLLERRARYVVEAYG